MEKFLNCLFTLLALPLGLFLLGYGIYMLSQGQSDHGVFLIVLGVLLLIAVLSGYTGAWRRKKLTEKLQNSENDQ